MIAARVVLGPEGYIRSFEAAGHGGAGPLGGDVVCAAFTVLARTAYQAMEALPGALVAGSADEPGRLRFRVDGVGREGEGRAVGIADFLVTGLSGLMREYPDHLGLTIERNWRG